MEKGIQAIEDGTVKDGRLKDVIFSSVVMTMAAHAYSFFNSSFVNDRMAFFVRLDYTTASMGRWFIQFYEMMRSWSYLPWMEGILMCLFIGLSLYMIVDILQIKRRISIWIVAGLYVTDISIVGGNLYEGDAYAFALMLSSLSVWIWNMKEKTGSNLVQKHIQRRCGLRIMLSAVLICLCLGTYGAYAPVAPTIVVLTCFCLLFINKDVKYLFVRAVEYVISFALGLCLYYIILRLFLKFQNLEMLAYMGEDRLVKGFSGHELLSYFRLAYKSTIESWCGLDQVAYGSVGMTKWIACSIFILGVLLFLLHMINERLVLKNKGNVIFLIVLIVLLPFSAGMIQIMAFGNVHFLMVFPYILFYIGIVKLCESEAFSCRLKTNCIFKKITNCVSMVVVALLILVVFRGIVITNMAYAGLEKNYTASRSIATRLMDRIESCEDSTGDETIIFVGDLSDNAYYRMPSGEGDYWKNKAGIVPLATYSTAYAYYGSTRAFLRDVMGFYRNMAYYSPGTFEAAETELITEMPVFPADGSVDKIGNCIIVKLSQ